MDADGDFMITWESFQERPVANQGDDAANSYGIYAQRYVRNDLLGQRPAVRAPTASPAACCTSTARRPASSGSRPSP